MSVLLITPPALADLPRLSAGMGAGVGGLFHQEYVADGPRCEGMGHFSSSAWWMDLAWSFPSRITLGVRAHLLRVPLDDVTPVGTVDLFPAVILMGYRSPGLGGRLHGFVGLGAGLAWARLQSPADTSEWTSREGEGEEVGFSRSHPFVLEVLAGADLELTDDFLVELSFVSVMMDTEVSFQPAYGGGDAGTLESEYAYSVKGRHLLLTLGLRWWFEWW